MSRYNVEHEGRWACFSTLTEEFITPFMCVKRYNWWRKRQYGKAGYVPLPEANTMTYAEAIERIKLRRQAEKDYEAE